MSTFPIVAGPEPVGIIIQANRRPRKPAVVWAYMWAADEETATDHWHLHVPVERAAA